LSNFDELPAVTIQLPIFNEMYVVERLLDAVARMDYPKEKLQIQVLDDSTDETVNISRAAVKLLQEKGFDIEHIHREDRTGFKAGALERGMETAKADYIFILDADFVPPPDILKKTIHYFTDPNIGMLQTRWGHLNAGYSLLTRLQAMLLDGHLLLEQNARCRSGQFFNFNGTAGIWRKSCITDAGGWEHDTLTEDMDLSYRAQLKGWRFVYLTDVITPAELPMDMDGFKNQQHRWTKGSIQVCLKLLGRIWDSPLPTPLKVESTAHLTSNFSYLIVIALCFLMYPGDTATSQYFLRDILVGPLFLVTMGSVAAFYAVSQWALHPRDWWKKCLMLPAVLALGIGMSVNNGKAVLEALFHHETAFIRTPKYGISGQKGTIRKKKYSALKSLSLFIECALAIYFGWLLVLYVQKGFWTSVPFILMFFGGFAYVALGSLKRMLPASWFEWNRSSSREVAATQSGL
jgi:cellulose synthase/poly-beta-1,6-N-acetylglucosamine synthase-like glycosyltransferase